MKSFYLIFIILIYFTESKLMKKIIPLEIGTKLDENEISETLSSLALKRLYHRLEIFNQTSCAMTAKFILLSITGIHNYNNQTYLNLTNNITENLLNIKNKINQNYVLQIEISPNHHFIILKKNITHLYILQGFQDTYTLRDWMMNKKIMEPYLTIDNFLIYLNNILDPNIDFHIRNYALYSLFLPKEFSPTKKMKKKIRSWFSVYKIELIHVSYQTYNFKENQGMNDFDDLLDEVMENNISKHNGRWDLSKYSLYDLQQSKDSIKKDFKYRLNKILNLN